MVVLSQLVIFQEWEMKSKWLVDDTDQLVKMTEIVKSWIWCTNGAGKQVEPRQVKPERLSNKGWRVVDEGFIRHLIKADDHNVDDVSYNKLKKGARAI